MKKQARKANAFDVNFVYGSFWIDSGLFIVNQVVYALPKFLLPGQILLKKIPRKPCSSLISKRQISEISMALPDAVGCTEYSTPVPRGIIFRLKFRIWAFNFLHKDEAINANRRGSLSPFHTVPF